MRSRVLTAIGLIPFVLGAFFCASPWPLWALAQIAAIICTIELSALVKSKRVWIGWLIGASILLSGPLIPLNSSLAQHVSHREEALQALLILLIGVIAIYFAGRGNVDDLGKRPQRTKSSSVGATLAPIWYFLPFYWLLRLHSLQTHPGPWNFTDPALMAIVPLWGGDTAAIFVGKAFGKHLLAPSISPKKTVEGSIANLLVCAGVGVPLGMWIGYSWWVSLACGVAAGILGQCGDLFESYVKRQAGVKDSGTLLPGHGGLLDRIDSILFTAPVVFALLILAEPVTRISVR